MVNGYVKRERNSMMHSQKQPHDMDMSVQADADRLSQVLGDHERYDAVREELVMAKQAESARLEVLKKGK